MKNITNQLIWVISIFSTYQITFASAEQDIDQEIFPTNINYNIEIITILKILKKLEIKFYNSSIQCLSPANDVCELIQ